MFQKFSFSRRRQLAVLACILALFLGAAGFLLLSRAQENRKFSEFTRDFFAGEITSDTLSLHYTLADPAVFGIQDYPVTFGCISSRSGEQNAALENLSSSLASFSPSRLSRENRITLDIMKLYCETALEAADLPPLYEPLSPSLGVQAQLPVLLAEYAFYDEQDILDYLALLKDMPSYFSSILDYEKEKADAGCFMSDTSADRITEQCSAFIAGGEHNYLQTIFQEKISEFPGLTEKECAALSETHRKLLTDHVLPAYQSLINGLNSLKGRGTNTMGLSYYPQGQEYYEYLLKSEVGVYDSPEEVENMLLARLQEDVSAIHALLSKDPGLIAKAYSDTDTRSPQEMLLDLQEKISEDFPALDAPEYEIKYVHEDLEEFLSPAFYLTPPLDLETSNSIYINGASDLAGTELYTTLAHEGFPGHLYQTVFFERTDPNPVRSLFEPGGYVEGWATYTESYAYGYALSDSALAELLLRNRSVTLCLYSLIDLGIHYHGWTPDTASEFLRGFGITDPDTCAEIYQYIIETPANYLKYYVGSLCFEQLQEEFRTQQGNDFSLKDFHEKLLRIGPAPFPVAEKYLLG